MMNAVLVSALLASGVAPAAQEAEAALTPLQIELSLPRSPDGSVGGETFVLSVLADSGTVTVLRAGREVAVPAADDKYRNVGVNMNCRARTSADGFRVELEFERSSFAEGSDPARPSFQTFSYRAAFRLRDGESIALVGGSGLREIRATLRVSRD